MDHHDTRRSFLIESLSIAGLGALGLSTQTAVAGIGRGTGLSLGLGAAGQSADVRRFLRAVIDGDNATVQSMLDSDAALLTARDDAGRSAYALALLHHHAEIAQTFRKAGHEPDLHEAALALDWDLFNTLAERDLAAVNANHPIGGTAMTAAALGGAGTHMWRVYAQCGVPNPDRAGASTRSPLRASLDLPDLPHAELAAATLLGNGANANSKEPAGSTPLHAAAARGSVEIVEMLIRKGANVGARDADGRTPLQLAGEADHDAVVKLLENHRSIPRDHDSSRRLYDVNGDRCREPDWEGLPIHSRRQVVGSAHSNIEAVRAELARDARLAHAVATTTEGAVEAGAHMGNHAIVNLLLEHGAPYSMPTAVMRGDTKRVKELLAEQPLRIHERGAHDFALLWYPVIGGGHIELAELLLDAGANIEHQHHLGTTALHFAIMRRQKDMVALLIERGADVNRAGRKFGGVSRTPLQTAQSMGHEAIATMLRQNGATR